MSTVNLSKVTVNLSKGEKINLSKQSDGLKKVMIGLGWDPVDRNAFEEVKVTVKPGFFGKLLGQTEREEIKRVPTFSSSEDIDCDAWVALLTSKNTLENFNFSKHTIYYGHLTFKEDIIQHHGDNLTGEGDGDDEEITINLDKIPAEYNQILIGVTIYCAKSRRQSFDQIKNTFVRVVDTKTNFEICRFNQSDLSIKGATNFIAGVLTRESGEWQFEAIGSADTSNDIKEGIINYIK
jgi:stress response protein SCP2